MVGTMGELEIATFLLDRGADINIIFRGKYGTAIGPAAYWGRLEMATLLLGRGANSDLTSHLRQKPRDLAKLTRYRWMVSLLDS